MCRDYNIIRSELSFAYLKTIIAHLGGSCIPPGPVLDAMGIDAVTQLQGNWSDEPYADKTIDIYFQLKSTSNNYTQPQENIGYSIDKDRYNKYIDRSNERRFFLLLLMVLPPEDEYEQWLQITPEQLVLKKCMYWKSLRGASKIAESSKTVHFHKNDNLFTTDTLRNIILPRFAEGKFFDFQE